MDVRKSTLIFALTVALIDHRASGAEQQKAANHAQKIFQRLTGVPIAMNDPRLKQMSDLVAAGKKEEAAAIAIEDKSFYNVTLRNIVSPFSSVNQSASNPLDDLQATIIGYIRDDRDLRGVLTNNLYYRGPENLPPAVEADNLHYLKMEEDRLSLKQSLIAYQKESTGSFEHVGVLTSRGFGLAYLSGGTNRRAVEFAMQIFLCAPITQWRDDGIDDYHVRRDVDRNPGGHPETYQNNCRSCHAIMDSMAGAFARYDFVKSRVAFSGLFNVWPKYNQNSHIYPEGFKTEDDSWANYAIYNQNTSFGWSGPVNGDGLKQYGRMLSEADAFAQCWVKRAYVSTCRDPDFQSLTQENLDRWTGQLKSNGYKLKPIFQSVVANSTCINPEDR